MRTKMAAKELQGPSHPRFWCRDCGKEAEELCGDMAHALWSVRKYRAWQANPDLQRLQNASTSAREIVQALLDAKDSVEAQLEQWQARLRQLQEAEKEVWAAVDEGRGPEAFQVNELGQLVQDTASLLGASCQLHLQNAENKWTAELAASGSSLLHPLVLQLHQNGSLLKEPEPPKPEPLAPARIEEVDLWGISRTLPVDRQEEKAATLARVQQQGVRRMTEVWCLDDPAWALEMLRSAAPTLEELYVLLPREEHLQAIHAMPALRRLVLECDKALHSKPPVLPGLPQGSLRWLRVWDAPLPTLLSVLRAHSATLDELWLEVGTPGSFAFPRNCNDLDALLGQCGLRVSRVVLWRATLTTPPTVTHKRSACPAQVEAVRHALPGTTVQCSSCEKLAYDCF